MRYHERSDEYHANAEHRPCRSCAGCFFVADFTDGGAALDVDATNFARTQTNLGVGTFAGQQLDRRTGGTSDLRALTGIISTQQMVVPTGILRIGSALPGLDRSFGPLMIC